MENILTPDSQQQIQASMQQQTVDDIQAEAQTTLPVIKRKSSRHLKRLASDQY